MTMHPIEITRANCARCGALVEGINGRYACTVCEWVNPWNDSPLPLPTAEDDPDRPRPRRRKRR